MSRVPRTVSQEANTPRSFVVLFLGRSGSTYLMEALGSHPRIDAGLEELGSRRGLGPEGQLAFARGFFASERSPGIEAVGFKTKLQDVLDPAGFAAVLADARAQVLLLQRRNVVKAVVSWFRSESVNRATGDWNVYRAEDRPLPSSIEAVEFVERLARYEASRERLQRYALDLARPMMALYYEDLLEEPRATIASVCGFLGVAPGDLSGRTVKATPDDLRLAVANFEELRAAAGPRFRPMFDEGPPHAAG